MQVYITKSFFHLLIFSMECCKMYARLMIGDFMMVMTMMMMTINYSRVCGRARDVLGKIARSKVLIVFKTELTESDCYIKDCTRWREAWNFFAQLLCLSISDILRNKKIDAQGGLIRVKNRIFSKKKKNKRLLSFKHIISKNYKKQISVRDKIPSRCALWSPAVKNAPACWVFTS